MSSYEKIIYAILQSSQISFQTEKQFKDLRNGLYRFDFYLPTLNICIEVNGAQHYLYTKQFHKKKTDFLKAQERDRRKISYCLAHNIPLYIIPYWDINKIHTINDILNEDYHARTIYHNDETWRAYKNLK